MGRDRRPPRRAAASAACLALLGLAGCARPADGGEMRLASPDGRVAIATSLHGGVLDYRVLHDGAEVVARSPVSLTLADPDDGRTAPYANLVVTSVERAEGVERYGSPPDGRHTIVRPYRAMTVHAREAGGRLRRIDLQLRAFDAGAAFRLLIPPQPATPRVRVAVETTRFVFPADYGCLAVHQDDLANSHEGEYAPVAARDLKQTGYYDLPLVCRTGRGGETVGIAESGLENFTAAYLVALPGHRPGVGIALTPHPDDPSTAVETPMTARGVATPWRVVMIADRAEALLASTLVDDLAAPSRVADTHWIVPGKAAWGWWSGLIAQGVADPGHNDATYRYYIDFAHRFGLRYYLIDRGWAWRGGDRDGKDPVADITRTADGVNMPALIRYAHARGVGLWLWVNWKALDGRMEEVLSLYQRLGVAGIKVDYLDRQDQQMVAFYHRLLASAARHRLMVDIHASFVPRGLDRTYPHYLTQEGVMGSEYNRWSRRDTARAHVELAYTRAALGPMDYAPGGFRNVAPAQFTPRHDAPQVMTTRAHQLALFVVFPSPLAVLADHPGAYQAGGKTAAGADFLRIVPTVWNETRGVAGDFGKVIAVARRSGSRWYVGAITDGRARDVAIPLDFLQRGRWRVASWSDGDRPDQVVTRLGEVTGGHGFLKMKLAATGGAVLVLTPAS